MKLLAIINAVPGSKLGPVMNALAHITLGLGSRIEGEPNEIDVVCGSEEQVRAFRNLCVQACEENEESIFADFPHTMSGGDTDRQVEIGGETPEPDMHYYAACFVGDDIPEGLCEFKNMCTRLKGYKSLHQSTDAVLLPKEEIDREQTPATDIKISMLINGDVANVLNEMILASLSLARKIDYTRLRLLDVPDGSGGVHPYISYHPYTIVKATSSGFMESMVAALVQSSELSFSLRKDPSNLGKSLVAVVFGDRDGVEAVITRDKTRLFNNEVGSKTLVPVAQAVSEKSHGRIKVPVGALTGDGKIFSGINSAGASTSSTHLHEDDPLNPAKSL